MTGSARRARAATLPVLALVLALVAGCSGDDDSAPSGGDGSPTGGATAAPVRTQVGFGEVTGHLAKPVREHLAAKVQAVVDRWIDAAYVGGRYPRSSFADSWPGFTPGARTEARHDRAVTSNADIGKRIDGVVVGRRRLVIDALAVHGRPVGVTARVRLGFRTAGRTRRDLIVHGQLELTHTQGGWRVFAYDLAKGDRVPGGGATKHGTSGRSGAKHHAGKHHAAGRHAGHRKHGKGRGGSR